MEKCKNGWVISKCFTLKIQWNVHLNIYLKITDTFVLYFKNIHCRARVRTKYATFRALLYSYKLLTLFINICSRIICIWMIHHTKYILVHWVSTARVQRLNIQTDSSQQTTIWHARTRARWWLQNVIINILNRCSRLCCCTSKYIIFVEVYGVWYIPNEPTKC